MTPIDKRPTPRTDAATLKWDTSKEIVGTTTGAPFSVVSAGLARILEREAAMLREALEYWIADET